MEERKQQPKLSRFLKYKVRLDGIKNKMFFNILNIFLEMSSKFINIFPIKVVLKYFQYRP